MSPIRFQFGQPIPYTVAFDGNLDTEVTLTLTEDGANIEDAYVFASDVQTELSIRYEKLAGSPRFALRVRGVDVLETLPYPAQDVAGPAVYRALEGHKLVVRGWYYPAGGARSMGIRSSINGCYGYDTVGVAEGATLASGELYLGQHPTLSAAGTYPATISVTTPSVGISDYVEVEGVILGDSISQSNLTAIGTGPLLLTEAQVTAGKRVFSLALGGAKVADQLAAWQDSPYRGDPAVLWTIIQLGINDIVTRTSAQIITDLQTLVDDIATNNPGADILIGSLTPAFGYFLEPSHQTKITEVNQAIAGGGGTPITGVTSRVTSYYAVLGGGTDSLVAPYDYGDHLHLSNAGCAASAAAYKAVLQGLGHL